MKKTAFLVITMMMLSSISIPAFATSVIENNLTLNIKTIEYKGEVYIRLSDLEKISELPVSSTKDKTINQNTDEPLTRRQFYTALVPEIKDNIPGFTGEIHNIPTDNPDHNLLATAWSLGYINMVNKNDHHYWLLDLDEQLDKAQAASILTRIYNDFDEELVFKITENPKYNHIYSRWDRLYYYAIDEGLMSGNPESDNPHDKLYLNELNLDKLSIK